MNAATLAGLIVDVRAAERRLAAVRQARRDAAVGWHVSTRWTAARMTRAVNRELDALGEPRVSHDTVQRLLSLT